MPVTPATPDERRNANVAAAIRKHLGKAKSRRRTSLEVTADRLGDFLDRYGDRLTGAERDQVSQVKFLVEQISSGEQS